MRQARKIAKVRGKETYRWKGRVECSICGHRHYAAIEVSVEHDEPIVPLECTECHNMTCYPECYPD